MAPSQPIPVRPAPPVPTGSGGAARREYVPGHHRTERGRDREPRAGTGSRSGAGVEDARNPQVIGDYEIVRTLGTGSFGKVKRELGCFGEGEGQVRRMEQPEVQRGAYERYRESRRRSEYPWLGPTPA